MSVGTVAIPDWNSHGVIPPLNQSSFAPGGEERSPYSVSLTDLTLRFGNSQQRRKILEGFLNFRAALHEAGLDKGFQWVDGSFVEDIETIEERPPRDIDVVTFFRLPQGQTQQTLFDATPHIFYNPSVKTKFHVDAYFQPLDPDAPEQLVARAAYWYSLWAHRRNEQWKGYLQIDLSNAEDETARANLDLAINQGGQE